MVTHLEPRTALIQHTATCGSRSNALITALLLLSTPSRCALASEPFQTNPGTRAMSMAGVFSAQADDSSAIWYNPAGPKRASTIKTDASLEWAQAPARDENSQHTTRTTLKYLGAYTDRLPWPQRNGESLGVGVAYFSTLRESIYVDAVSNPIDQQPYGWIDVQYHQLSMLVSGVVSRSLAAGGTVDGVWTDVDCQSYNPCVKRGPLGMGVTAGTLYSLAKAPWGTLTFGAVWRSAVSLDYLSSSRSGLADELQSRLPGRPESRNLGLHLQMPATRALINTNVVLEKTLWSAATSKGARLTDYRKLGASAEFIFPVTGKNVLAFRLGISRALPQNNSVSSAVNVAALGTGYSFAKNHFLDFAWESRKGGTPETDSKNYLSASYSFQQ